MKLRIGLIGLGDQWHNVHRPALRMLSERFDVRAIYASVSKLAENAVAEFQADPVDGYQSMVHRADIDAVLILESSWMKFLPAIAACRAGKAVYWACDLDIDPDDDQSFCQCVEDSGVAFMAQLPRRYAPATLRLKELIATHLGPPRLIFCHRRVTVPPSSQSPMAQRGRGGESGAPVCDIATRERAMRGELIQAIDWCSYLVGRGPQSVMSANHDPSPGADYQALSLSFAAAEDQRPRATHATLPGVTAQISCGSYIPACWQEAIGFRPPAAVQVCCQNGVAFVDLPGTLVWFDDAGRHQETLDGEAPVGEKMLAQFHRAVTSLVRNVSGLDDAYRAAAIYKAAGQSFREGRRVDLSFSATGKVSPNGALKAPSKVEN